MLKHGNELDDMIEAQSRAGLPHSGVIRNGKIPYGTRQLVKQPGKAAALYLLLLPGLLVAVVGAVSRFAKDLGDTGSLITGITAGVLALVYVIVVVASLRKAKRLLQEEQERKKQQKRKKKRR